MARRKSTKRGRVAVERQVEPEIVVEEECDEMGKEQEGLGGVVAPALGVAAGAFAATKGADMLGVPEKWAPWGTAALGALGALMTEGRTRHAAIGFAAAGAGIGVLHMLGVFDLLATRIAPVPQRRQADAPALAEAPAQEPPPDAIKQVDFQKAIDEIVAKNEAQLQAMRDSADEKFRELSRAYESRIGEISASYEQRVADQDQTISNLLGELRRARAASVGPRLVRDEIPAPVDEPLVAEASATPEGPVETGSTGPSPETVSKAHAIAALLSQEEYDQLKQVAAQLPPAVLAAAEAQIAKLSPEDAVAYLRANVLKPRDAA